MYGNANIIKMDLSIYTKNTNNWSGSLEVTDLAIYNGLRPFKRQLIDQISVKMLS